MNISQILSDVNFLVGSTSATYANTDKVRNINVAYNDVCRLIWESADGWQYDDRNSTTLPIAKTTLVHNQQDYSLPTNAQRLHRVEVKDKSGTWQKLKQIDWSDTTLAMPEYYKTPDMPMYYDVVGLSVNLYPAPASGSVTLASGIAFYVERDVTEIGVSATTTTPGFAVPFHRILSLAAAIDFSDDDSQRQFLAGQRARLEQGLVRFYGKRNIERQSNITPKGKKNWQQYL